MHLGGTHHLALLNHPVVYEQLRSGSRQRLTRLASHGTAASCSGFISTLRRSRARRGVDLEVGMQRGEVGGGDLQRAQEHRVVGIVHAGDAASRGGGVDVDSAFSRREVGDDVELGLEVEAQEVGLAQAVGEGARGAERAPASTGSSGDARSVSHSAAAAAPAREHSRLISPRCSASDVK